MRASASDLSKRPMNDTLMGTIAGLDVAALAIIVWVGAIKAYLDYKNGK